jgi:hypothetical protein
MVPDSHIIINPSAINPSAHGVVKSCDMCLEKHIKNTSTHPL